MNRKLIISILSIALLIGLGAWWFSPTQVVKRRTAFLLETMSLNAGSGQVVRQKGVYSLNGLLAPQVELITPSLEEANGEFERSELESIFSWLCNQAKETKFELQQLRSIEVNGDNAKVNLALKAMIELPTYRPADGTYDVTLDWVNLDGTWRLRRATGVKNP